MFITECDNEEVRKEASKLLKNWGVKHRFKKIEFKNADKKEAVGVFKVPLEKMKKKKAKLSQFDQPICVPAFLVDSCNYLRDKIDSDGLFRRSGVAVRQKELKILISKGQLVATNDHNVMDIADLLKLFFRELPEPCIPYVFHDILQRCLDDKKRRREAVLLAILLLPIEHIYTLAYLLQFLHEVADHQHKNRMDINNLATIWTPNLMPFKTGQVNNKEVLEKRLTIVQILIENSSSIGMIPECLCVHLSTWQSSSSLSSHDELENFRHRTKKKERRSGSLTRMLSGIKKIVRKSPDELHDMKVTPEQPVAHTPRILSTAKKRKGSEPGLPSLSAKKRKELLEWLPQGALLPDVCTTHLTPRILVAQPLNQIEEGRPKHRSRIYNSRTPQRDEKRKYRSLSGSRLRFSHFGIGRKPKKCTMVMEDSGLELSASPNTLDLTCSSEYYMSIPRSEYEDIKSRVSRIESRISSEFDNIVGVSMSDLEITPDRSQLDNMKIVQSAYERTLESAEKLSSSASEELAHRFSRELKIQWSSEKKAIRSPSARKIGTIRRRSKENAPLTRKMLSLNLSDRTSYSSQGYSTQLPIQNINSSHDSHFNPLATDIIEGPSRQDKKLHKSELFDKPRRNSDADFSSGDFDLSYFGMLTRSQARRASSFHVCDLQKSPISTPFYLKDSTSNPGDMVNWKNAETFLNEEEIKGNPITGRPSLAKLRSQNAGMVLAKTKLFNTLSDSESKPPTKAFKTSRTGTNKSCELRKKNSSKSSKERKLQRKDSRGNGGRVNRQNTGPPQSPEHNNKDTYDELKTKDVQHEIGKENLPKTDTRFVQKHTLETSLYVGKTIHSNFKENLNHFHSPRKSNISSPLRECNKHNSRINDPQTMKYATMSSLLGKSPKTIRLTTNPTHRTPNKTAHSVPRRSPRQLNLK